MSWKRAVWGTWTFTRVILVLMTFRTLPIGMWFNCADDILSYEKWGHQILATGSFPLADPSWQYPPGFGALVVAAALPTFGYWLSFVAIVLAADLAGLLLLMRAGARAGATGLVGASVWTLGIFALGRVVYGRFDLVVCALVIAALVYAVRRPALAGALLAVGALVKVWPVAMLVGVRKWRDLGQATVVLLIVASVLGGAFTLLVPGSWSFLRFQSQRGIQIESVAATPFLVGHAAHGPWRIQHRYGADEILGTGVAAASMGCLVATVVAFLFLALWLRRYQWTPAVVADAALFVVLLALVTSRVLSPQYFLWALAVAAVCVVTRGSSQHPVVALILVIAFVTQLEYPYQYAKVMDGTWPGAAILVLRNALLVWATILSGRRLWPATKRPAPAAPAAQPEHRPLVLT